MSKNARQYADLDVVNTRGGLRIIADLNNIPYCDRNVMREPEDMALRMSLSKKDTVRFLKTVEKSVGTIIRVVIINRKLKKTEHLREINEHWYESFSCVPSGRSSRVKTKAHAFQTSEELETQKYVSHFEDGTRFLFSHSKTRGGC